MNAADFLAHCQASSTGNPVLEKIRDRGAETVLAVFRLVKNAIVHAVDNRAVTQTAAQSAEILRDFSAMVGQTVSLTFIGDTIFVCGQLLRASRATYESAIELGEIFGRSGVSEVSFDGAVTAEDLLLLADAVVQGYREPDKRGAVLAVKIPHVGMRRIDAGLERRDDRSEVPLQERILILYATALVVMRRFFDSIAEGAMLLPHRVKRLSQQLVTLSEAGDPALLGLTTMANAHRDDAGRAVLGAIMTVVLGRQITTERVVLARLAMAALLADAGRVRLAGVKGRDELIPLADDVDARVPAATATVCLTTGGVNVPNAFRTVVTHEATTLEREGALGPVYGKKMAPLIESHVLRLARALIDELAPRDAAVAPKSPLDALQALGRKENVDPVLLKLLVNALGLVPTGSVIEFDTGEWGVVVGPSKNADAFDRPIVRLVTDRNGRPLPSPREVDLGATPSGVALPRIAHVVAPREARFNVTRVFLG